MNISLLSATAVFTLVLNIVLTIYLLKDKIRFYSYNIKEKEIINFILTPTAQSETTIDTEILATEIISLDDNYNG
jgi:hypothetical protein